MMKHSRMGPGRSSGQSRERLVMLGGGTAVFALFVVVGSILMSGTTGVATNDSRGTPAVDPEQALNTVVLIAPVGPVPKGTKLTMEQLREINWPRDQVPERAIRYIHEAKDMFSTTPLSPDQPIIRTQLTQTAPNFGISEQLPPGHRAVTIEVDATSGVEGWATPGAHVDVLLTYLDQKDGVQKTRVAVEDATVLSYGGIAAPSNRDITTAPGTGPVSQVTTVTLAVPFQEALKIQTARAIGRITLILRNTNDIKTPGIDVFDAQSWDKASPKKETVKKDRNGGGFARMTGPDGKVLHFELEGDSKWNRMGDEDR